MNFQACKTAWQPKALAKQPTPLGLNTGDLSKGGRRETPPKVVFWPAHAHCGTPVTPTYIIHTQNKDKWSKGEKKIKCISLCTHKTEALARDSYGRCTELSSLSLLFSNSGSQNRRTFGEWRSKAVKASDKQYRQTCEFCLSSEHQLTTGGKIQCYF